MTMQDIVIAEAVRSAVGRAHKGSLAQKRPDELAGDVIRALLARVPQIKADDIEDLILGCAMPEGEQGLNIARVAGLLGGLPENSGGLTINRFCSSGLQSIALAAGSILMGSYDAVVAGGVESMSMVPMTGNKLSASPEAMERIPSVYTPMGITAENVATKFNVSRTEQDEFALKSHKKASEAREKKKFDDEVVTVRAVKYNGAEKSYVDFRTEELVRPDTTLEGLGTLKPAFSAKGSVTAGNSSPLSDGAAAALVLSKAKADALGIKGLGYFRSFATVGVDPAIMGIGPVPAVQKLLQKTGLKISDIDLFEVNEAFAVVAMIAQRELGIPREKLNVNGGATALGHPIGASGARVLTTLLAALTARGGRRGLASLCIGGGEATAMAVELA